MANQAPLTDRLTDAQRDLFAQIEALRSKYVALINLSVQLAGSPMIPNSGSDESEIEASLADILSR